MDRYRVETPLGGESVTAGVPELLMGDWTIYSIAPNTLELFDSLGKQLGVVSIESCPGPETGSADRSLYRYDILALRYTS
jgi:hypothetical protein